MKKRFGVLDDLVSIFYPLLCLACGEEEVTETDQICIACEMELPRTNFHFNKHNPFTDRFSGRIPLQSGAAFYYFFKGGKTQHLIHQIKYHGKKNIAVSLGRIYGNQLKTSPLFKDIDLILPVPLHAYKLRQRGYNQSAVFAEGLSQAMGIPWKDHILKRVTYTTTQTKKSKLDRAENVEQVFMVAHPKQIEGKHVLIVDDVLTTGATLESCANEVLKVPGTKISLATIAMAKH